MDCFFQYDFGSGKSIEQHTDTGPCTPPTGGVVQCCDINDTCRADGICESDGISDGASGFYMAGCTDPNFKDPACVTRCTSYSNSDVVYDFGVGSWRCCGSNSSGERDCGRPEGPTFSAPAPAALGFVATIVATSQGVALATGVPLLSATASHAPSSTDAGSPQATSSSPDAYVSNSTGHPALDGLIAAVAVLAALLLASAAWAVYRRRKRRAAAARGGAEAGNMPVNMLPHPQPLAVTPAEPQAGQATGDLITEAPQREFYAPHTGEKR